MTELLQKQCFVCIHSAKRGKQLFLLELLLFESFVLQFPVSDVSNDFGKSKQFACAILNFGDDDTGPEHGAVLLHSNRTPIFVATHRSSRLQLTKRAQILHIHAAIEQTEMLSNDFSSGVTQASFRSSIPRRHCSIDVKPVNGIVDNVVEQ